MSSPETPPADEEATPTGRCTKAAKIARVNIVYRLLLDGLDTPQIMAEIGKKHPRWNVKERAIANYIHDARQLLIEESKPERAVERGRSLARRHNLYGRCLEAEDYRTADTVQNRIDELLGLKEPIEINVNDARRDLVQLLVEEAMREAADATGGADSEG